MAITLNPFTGQFDITGTSGGGGGGSNQYLVQKYTLNSTDITNKFVTLSQAPTTSNLTILDVIGGPQQDYGTDFTVSGSTLSWSGLTLDGILVSGDKLVVQHN